MTVETLRTVACDIVVVGAGGAGLRAALEAAAAGAKTVVLSKSLLGKAGTAMAQYGIAAPLGIAQVDDDWRAHFRDTVRAGCFAGDWRMAQLHAREAAERVRELESWGALFDRTSDGRIQQRRAGGHRFARLAGGADRVGLDLLRALQQRVASGGIDVHMECDARRLLLDDGRIAGVLACGRASGEFVLFRCKAVILAAGGAGQAWRRTSNPREATGDGIALALAAGAELTDMEFVQFHPTGLCAPSADGGLLVTEAVRAAGGVLRNAAGRRFMSDYAPADSRDRHGPAELWPANEIARAIDAEIRAGRGTPRGGVWLDVASRRPPEFIRREFASLCRQVEALGGRDLARESVEVGPTCHATLGGVRVDPETAASTVSGLFAAGEAAAGLDGADRLAGNALSGALVFGRRAGLHAAGYCRSLARSPNIDSREVAAQAQDLLAPLERAGGETAQDLHMELKDCMWRQVGVVRTESGLRSALAAIRALAQRVEQVAVRGGRRYNPDWHLALDLRSLLAFAQATAVAALERRESRGSHARSDFPGADPALAGVNLVLRKTGRGLEVARRLGAEMPIELKRRIDWDKEWLTNRQTSGSGAATRAAAGSKTTG